MKYIKEKIKFWEEFIMGKRSKLLALLVAGVVAATTLVGCGSKSGTENNEGGSGETKTLTVWSLIC